MEDTDRHFRQRLTGKYFFQIMVFGGTLARAILKCAGKNVFLRRHELYWAKRYS